MQERELIDHIRQLVGDDPKQVIKGIGDDCAVLEKTESLVWLVTMDTLVESVHFDLSWHQPGQLGSKALAVNVSDIAAMGGSPCCVLLSLGLPEGFDDTWATAFTRGFTRACRKYGCLLIGGDTVCSPDRVVLSITLIGEMAREKVIYRQGAQPGDVVWVSGDLGSAAAGLSLYQQYNADCRAAYQPLLDAHLEPRAEVGLAGMLADSGDVHAMMDLSDGLATDLSHLCSQSNVGARIEAGQLPRHPLLQQAAKAVGADPLSWMISGGEDYGLLFTTPVDAVSSLATLAKTHDHAIYPVGSIVEGSGVMLVSHGVEHGEKSIDYQGFDHFSNGS